MTVPSPYGSVSASKYSNIALRAAHARAKAPIRARPRTSAWREKALGGAVILLRCWLSMSNHQTNDCPITVWYGGSTPTLKHRPPAAKKCAEACFVLEMGIRLAYTSVNVCVHSSTVRQNRAVFGYVIASIARFGSGEPLGAAGDAYIGWYDISVTLFLFYCTRPFPPPLPLQVHLASMAWAPLPSHRASMARAWARL